MSRRSPLFTVRQLLFGGFLAVIAVLDPFGLASSSDAASAQWLNRLFSHFYPALGQQRIAVVLIDDRYVQRHHSAWPLPYAEQAKLFKNLLSYQPKAVFVDLLYSHDHSQGERPGQSSVLANVFERYQQREIPLVLANTGVQRGEDGSANTLESLANVSTPALVTWSGQGDRYPIAMPTSMGPMQTPAFALYREFCRDNPCQPSLPDTANAVESPSMAIQWGSRVANEQTDLAGLDNCSPMTNAVVETLKQLGQALFWRLRDAERGRCPYHLTVTASDLEISETQDRALLRSMLQGRLVLVGADITSASDLVQSPIHGKIPGVYLHAMALDNLLIYGLDYEHDAPNFSSFDINCLDVLELALLALIVWLKALHQRARESVWPNEHCRFFRTPGPYVLAMVGVLILTCIALRYLNLTPVNVLGIAMLSLLLFEDRLKQALAQGN